MVEESHPKILAVHQDDGRYNTSSSFITKQQPLDYPLCWKANPSRDRESGPSAYMMLSTRSSALRMLVPMHKSTRPIFVRLHGIVTYNHNGWRSFTSSSPSLLSSTTNKNNKRTATQAKKDYEFCVDLVQNRDRESYLCGLLLPANARRSYFAIRAFNVELASIKDGSVSRKVGGAQFDNDSGASMALKIRLQWWRQALNTIYSEEDGSGDYSSQQSLDPLLESMIRSSWHNPVVRELDAAVHQSQLTRRFLDRLVEARESDLDVSQFDTMKEQIQYAENTFSSLLYLSLECTNVREEAVDLVAHHAGIGQGIVMALRAANIRWARGESSVPRDLLPTDKFPYHQLVDLPNATISDEEKERLKHSIEQMAGVASSYLARARENQGKVPKHARPCFLPVVPAIHYLSKLEAARYDTLDETLAQSSNLRLLVLLSRTWLTGIF